MIRSTRPSGGSIASQRPQHTGPLARLHLDLPLLVLLLLLCGFGLVVLYSAAGASEVKLKAQVIRLTAAFLVMFAVAQVPPVVLRKFSPLLYLVGVLMLAAVLVVGTKAMGATRWLDLGLFRFQPSEILKFALPMMVAWFLSQRALPPGIGRVAVAAALTAVPVVMIAKQPDLGTSLLVASAGALVMFLAGMRWRLIGFLAVVGAAAMPVMWSMMRPYQRQRVLTFLDPSSDPLGSGYHIIQAQIAIGSGGLYGKGWMRGTQSHLEFLPERSTDFIFAVIGEEWGLAGILVLLTLYLLIILRGLYIAAQAQDTYSRLLGGALVLVFFVYLFVNTGMVTGLLPVVGVPLPLISYGGTSLVTIMAGFGVLMAIQTHKKIISI